MWRHANSEVKRMILRVLAPFPQTGEQKTAEQKKTQK